MHRSHQTWPRISNLQSLNLLISNYHNYAPKNASLLDATAFTYVAGAGASASHSDDQSIDRRALDDQPALVPHHEGRKALDIACSGRQRESLLPGEDLLGEIVL